MTGPHAFRPGRARVNATLGQGLSATRPESRSPQSRCLKALAGLVFCVAAVAHADPVPDACIQGYVWREAFEGDHVCVTPAVRAQAARDNKLAESRRAPGGGAHGPDTCKPGFVWREARADDHVCVTPEVREQTARDNREAPSRWQQPPAAANGGTPTGDKRSKRDDATSGISTGAPKSTRKGYKGTPKLASPPVASVRRSASFVLPEFPWPPPPYSTRLKLPHELVVAHLADAPTNGDVVRRMEQALVANGYTQLSYYAIPDGFALVTQIERIDAEAASAAEQRWSIEIEPVRLIPFNLGAYLDALLGKNGDRFRVIVFTFTPTPFVTSADPVAPADAIAWVEKGATALPAALAARPYDPNAACHALVYEFHISSLGARLQTPSDFDGDRHLRAAGILTALERP